MDIFLISILLVSSVRGAQNGFAYTVKSFLSWFICMAAGIFGCSAVKELLISNTGINDYISDMALACAMQHHTAEELPDICAEWISPAMQNGEAELAQAITSLILTIISFLIIVIAVRLIFSICLHLFSKKYHKGVIGFTDGVLGMIFGLASGFFLILLLFIFFIPLFSLWFSGFASFIGNAMDNSILASVFYNNNILLKFLNKMTF